MAATGLRTVAAILVAGGSGSRLGADAPKAFVTVGPATLLEHAVARFSDHPKVRDVLAVVPSDRLGEAAALVPGVAVVAGGVLRQDSVSAGIAALADDVELVLVHDVARPFVPADVIDRVLAALEAGADAVIPALPVTDTIKQVDADGVVTATIDRTQLVAVQTPQGFGRAVLAAAHRDGSAAVTDDAALVELGGGRVVVVEGSELAFKITTKWDLDLAAAMMLR